MESLGKTLKKIREARYLSIEDISEKTRIPKKIISNIEEDKLSEISSAFYARGFVRSYSQFLGALEEVPIREYLSDIKEKTSSQLMLKGEKVPDDWFLRHKKHIGVAVLTVFCIWLALFSVTQASRFVKNTWVRHKARVAEKQESMKAAVLLDTKHLTGPKATQGRASSAATEAKSKGIILEIEARYNTWMHVVSDGKTLFIGVLKKKQKDSWQTEKDIELELGNAGGVNLRLNGKSLGIPGKKGDKKSFIITKDGIEKL